MKYGVDPVIGYDVLKLKGIPDVQDALGAALPEFGFRFAAMSGSDNVLLPVGLPEGWGQFRSDLAG
jgi:hypothetical protein